MNNYLDNFYNNWILDNSADKYLLEDQYPLQEDKYYRIDKPLHIQPSSLSLTTQIKYYLVKYRRIIGIVLLILLFYIIPSVSIYSSIDKQCGGGSISSAIKNMKSSTVSTYSKLKSSTSKSYSKYADKTAIAMSRGALKHTYRAGKDAVKYGADVYASYSDMIFTILYQIAFVIIICIIFVPSLAFVVGGIVCFTLLQRRINYLKSL